MCRRRTKQPTRYERLRIKADSADPTAIRDAVIQAVAHLGRLDIVVVNAGILRLGDLQAVSLQELDLMLNVNVRGVFLAIQAAAAHFSEGSRVITIGSNTAVRSWTRWPSWSRGWRWTSLRAASP
jgi:3-oxoacyl-[acyl-carrier protein] reductase